MIDALMLNIWARLFALRNRDSGQTMAEYALVLGVITAGIIIALGTLGDTISGALDSVSADI